MLYAFTGSNRPVSSTLPLVNLINVCSIISSDRFKELYPKFHPSWNALWKIELALDSSSDESSSSDEDRDELELNGPSAKKSKAAMERELKLAAKTAPPSMTLHTSTGGFNLYKRAVPLVYFCQNAFDKFAKGGQGKSWFKIDWDKLAERAMREGDWELRDDVKEVVVEESRSTIEVEIPVKTKKPRTTTRRERAPRGDGSQKAEREDSSSEESDGSQLKDIESQSSEEVSESEDGDSNGASRSKRKRGDRTPGGKRKRKDTAATPSKRRKTAKSSRKKIKETYDAITAQLDPHLLPKDPYERALHLLHVGATPDTLPCRESEFVDVLMRVEEGVEGGGGGCLCE